MRILLAEDDAVSRLILRRALERFGHECVVVTDGEQAWTVFEGSSFDVVISDRMMPGVDGIELCRRVRGAHGSPYTYFVFMTALDDKLQFLEGMEAGADDYLTKPVDMDELQARLIAASRVTSLHRRLIEQNAELERLSKASHDAARTDALTLAGNRLRLREDLDALVARCRRYDHHYAAALCDIDEFKRYNDRYGHLGGDEALRRVAQAIRAELRAGDSLYRYGGEEFLVILPEQQLASAAIAMERVRRAVEDLSIPHLGRALPPPVVTVSAGIALLDPDVADTEDWLRRADQALYRAKSSGRNRVALLESIPPAVT